MLPALTRPAPHPRAWLPQPYLFFGGGGGGSNLASSWQDAGKFLVGFSAVAAIAIPAILYHAQVGGQGGQVGNQVRPGGSRL